MHTSPTSQQDRISVVDSVRGIALMGILLMNVPYFGNPYQANFNLNIIPGDGSGANFWCWWVINHFFEGTMRGLFSILFGAGALLLLDRLERNPPVGLTPADIYYRRLIWLLVFGLFNAYILLWAGDILYAYALCGLFLYPFRNWKPRQLILISALFMLISTLQHSSKMWNSAEKRAKGEAALQLERLKKPLSEKQKEDLEEWDEYKQDISIPHQKQEAENERKSIQDKSYAEIFNKMKGVNGFIQTKEMYNEIFFDALSFFLLGMALFRLGFLDGSQPIKNYALMALAGYSVGIPLAHYSIRAAVQTGFDISLLPQHIGLSLYQIKRVALALGHLGLIMLIYKTKVVQFAFDWFANVGQMAFSNYLMQSIFGALFFHGYGLNNFGKLERYQLYQYVLGVWIFQLLFSKIWLIYFKFGPFEWVWRSLTYWKRQPMLRS